jgi:EmrB/QacA subfamily drug resistance transporter
MEMHLTSQVDEARGPAPHKWLTLAAACVALFMAILDNLVLNVAIPTINADLEPSTAQLQWIISAYTLVFASLQITAGGLGDRYGRKKFFLAGIAAFSLTSGATIFVESTEALIALRALMGIGGALIMPLSLSLIADAFPAEERGKALGLWSAISVSGLALGPIVGGFIVEHWTWHWIFLINVPIGAAAFALTLLMVRESRDPSGDTTVDIPGTVAVSAAVGLLTWGLIKAGEEGWTSSMVVGSLVASAAAFAIFIAIEQRVARPMVPLGLFRSRMFTGANVTALIVAFLISGLAFTGTMYFQNVHDYSPIESGMTMLPMVAVMMIMSPITGGLVGRVQIRTLILIGLLISGTGALFWLRASVDASYWTVLPAMMLVGLGNSFLFAPMTTGVMNSVPAAQVGVGSAVNGAVRETGFAFGVAVLGAIANQTYHDSFAKSGEVASLREQNGGALAPVVDLVGNSINYAGNWIRSIEQFQALPAPAKDVLDAVSSQAYVDGMHAAFIITGLLTVVAAFGTWVLIGPDLPAPQTAPAHEPERAHEASPSGLATGPVGE